MLAATASVQFQQGLDGNHVPLSGLLPPAPADHRPTLASMDVLDTCHRGTQRRVPPCDSGSFPSCDVLGSPVVQPGPAVTPVRG